MSSLHRQLLDRAVERHLPFVEPLRNAAICITGASGFLASSLVAFLSVLDQTAGLNLRLFANARRPPDKVPLFRFLDLQPDVEWCRSAVEDVILPEVADLILIHTASYGSPRDYLREPIATYSANTQGLMNLFSQGRSLRQFVYFSSAEIYGQPPETSIPTPESYIGGVDTLSVRSIYGESKRMAEVLGACLGEQRDIPFVAIRPWNVYGPGQRLEDGRVPMEFIRQALETKTITLASNGRPRRAFCYAWDGIAQIAAALGRPDKVIAYNIGNSTEEISILDTARLCAEACGFPAQVVSFNPAASSAGLQRCAPDTRAISQHVPISYTPLKEGLKAMVEWHSFLT